MCVKKCAIFQLYYIILYFATFCFITTCTSSLVDVSCCKGCTHCLNSCTSFVVTFSPTCNSCREGHKRKEYADREKVGV
ncbi:putative 4Fe-4S ferredoxin-type, iron-sulfur binding domain-containing protein [Helianthus annuus]|uniref:4Fe-4S ferredoxin-type, iron-sulfur binding domain-containing protein n=1 Tax=Helianthus annuus TaxID=4232 RepID=A0A251S335_HELAN|nr:putative 4Fe-4S ferredoxin-type, iron-sulfur binding domain-containing protein [Helianthus annuus]